MLYLLNCQYSTTRSPISISFMWYMKWNQGFRGDFDTWTNSIKKKTNLVYMSGSSIAITKIHEFTPAFLTVSPQRWRLQDQPVFSHCCLSQSHRCLSDEGSGMQKQPGPAEALKQMLFRLQAVEAELQRQQLSPGATAANQKKECQVLTDVSAIFSLNTRP